MVFEELRSFNTFSIRRHSLHTILPLKTKASIRNISREIQHVMSITNRNNYRVLADLNLAPSALRWWEKGGVGIIGKGYPKVSFLLELVTVCVGRRRKERPLWRPTFHMVASLLQLNVPSGPGSIFAMELRFSVGSR